MKWTHWLSAGFIVLITIYSLLFALGLIEPSPRAVLPLVLFIVSFAVYLTLPVFEEKWVALKQRQRLARRPSQQATLDAPAQADPATLSKREFSPPEPTVSSSVRPQPRAAIQNVDVPSESSTYVAPADQPSAPRSPDSGPRPSTDSPAAIAGAQPVQPPREVDPVLVRDCIHAILTKLDHVSAFPELIPDIELLFRLVPEASRQVLSKRTRTIAEHLVIARIFEKSGFTEEKFCERTAEGIPAGERTYSQPVSVAALQDCKRELRWLQEFERQVAAHDRRDQRP